MQSLSHEFLVLSRQLGQAQQRCSAALAAQAAQVEALQSEVMRLRAAVVVRDTRLAMANEALKAAAPGLLRCGALARQVAAMAERIAALSRERLRWMPTAARSAPASDAGVPQAMAPALRAATGDHAGARVLPADPGLAAASLVICQTGCISHDDYWRVQDHCRRTGKECVLVAHSLTALQDQVLGSLVPAPAPHVLSDTDQPVHRLARADTGAAGDH